MKSGIRFSLLLLVATAMLPGCASAQLVSPFTAMPVIYGDSSASNIPDSAAYQAIFLAASPVTGDTTDITYVRQVLQRAWGLELTDVSTYVSMLATYNTNIQAAIASYQTTAAADLVSGSPFGTDAAALNATLSSITSTFKSSLESTFPDAASDLEAYEANQKSYMQVSAEDGDTTPSSLGGTWEWSWTGAGTTVYAVEALKPGAGGIGSADSLLVMEQVSGVSTEESSYCQTHGSLCLTGYHNAVITPLIDNGTTYIGGATTSSNFPVYGFALYNSELSWTSWDGTVLNNGVSSAVTSSISGTFFTPQTNTCDNGKQYPFCYAIEATSKLKIVGPYLNTCTMDVPNVRCTTSGTSHPHYAPLSIDTDHIFGSYRSIMPPRNRCIAGNYLVVSDVCFRTDTSPSSGWVCPYSDPPGEGYNTETIDSTNIVCTDLLPRVFVP